MHVRRLLAVTLVGGIVVLGVSFLLGNGNASTAHTCSVPDRLFIETVSSNMAELGYWSDSLRSGDATAGVVVREARAEAVRVTATAPTDPTLAQTRSLLRPMLLEYARAIVAHSHGGDAGSHMYVSYSLANAAHNLLVKAQPGLAALGCSVAPMLAS